MMIQKLILLLDGLLLIGAAINLPTWMSLLAACMVERGWVRRWRRDPKLLFRAAVVAQSVFVLGLGGWRFLAIVLRQDETDSWPSFYAVVLAIGAVAEFTFAWTARLSGHGRWWRLYLALLIAWTAAFFVGAHALV